MSATWREIGNKAAASGEGMRRYEDVHESILSVSREDRRLSLLGAAKCKEPSCHAYKCRRKTAHDVAKIQQNRTLRSFATSLPRE